MKYVALLSGGKDSCYNLVHCAQNGHELVAAASLGPEPGKGPTILIQIHPTKYLL
jgi:diphthine-ammonia ligase